MSGTNIFWAGEPLNDDNPLQARPSWADAYTYNKSAIGDYVAQQRAIAAQQGLWNEQTGLPTTKGAQQAGQAYAGAMVGSTVAPGEQVPGLTQRVSTRVPTAVGVDATAVHSGNDLQIGTDSITGTSAEPKVVAKLQGYPDIPAQPGQDSQSTLSGAISHMKDNLRWIYDNMIPAVRDQAAGWYDGANKLTGELANQYGVPHEAVAGMTARLSPGTDWNQNVSMAKRALDIHTNQANSQLAPEQADLIQSYIDKQKRPPVQQMMQSELDGMAGKTYGQLDNDMQRAMFIRSFDEAKTAADPTNAYYPVIHPEGRELGNATLADKVTPQSLGWQSLDNIGSAVSILRNPDRANISEQLGGAHKIRSFYNNIVSPNATNGDVTVDTHQIAASHLLPIGISDPVVEHGMSGPPYSNQTGSTGLYGVYADAVRGLANDLGLLPRQVQSITWEGARGLFPAAMKRSKSQVQAVRDLWSNSSDATATRNAIGASRGVSSGGDEPTRIPAPDWYQPGP